MINQREISIPKLLIGLAAMMLISVAGAGAETPARLTDVSVSAKDDATSVTVKTGSVPKYHASLIDPRRLVVDFEGTEYEWRKTPLPGTADPIKEIRGSQFRKGITRLVIQLSKPAKFTVTDAGDGIVIVLAPAPAATVASAIPAAPAATPVKPAPKAEPSAPTTLAQTPPGAAPDAPAPTTLTPPAEPETAAPAPQVASAAAEPKAEATTPPTTAPKDPFRVSQAPNRRRTRSPSTTAGG
jgi:hypothetical protein